MVFLKFYKDSKRFKQHFNHDNFTPLKVCPPNFGVVEYSYILAIVLTHYACIPIICRHRDMLPRSADSLM